MIVKNGSPDECRGMSLAKWCWKWAAICKIGSTQDNVDRWKYFRDSHRSTWTRKIGVEKDVEELVAYNFRNSAHDLNSKQDR